MHDIFRHTLRGVPIDGRALLVAGALFGVSLVPAHRILTAPLSAQTETAEGIRDVDEPGSELRVWLVTAAPGDAVWERYGHNAIRVLDTRTGRDVSYNWGIFDFQQVDFIPRFLQGRMLYRMAVFRTAPMIDSYARANREVLLQELDLTPAQKQRLVAFAERNALPENAEYIYQYFLDNCSTRVRDLLDLVLDGALRDTFAAEHTGATFRFHTRRLTSVDPLIYTGMDLLLGPPVDQPITAWDEMFIPMVLRDEIRSFRVTAEDGSTRPLVLAEDVVVPSDRPPTPAEPPHWLWIYLLIGLAAGGVLASGHLHRVRESSVLRRSVFALGVAWSLFGGVIGLLLVALLFTDHVFSYWNENLFLVNPLMLGTAVLMLLSLRGGAWPARARTAAVAVAAVAFVGLVWHLLPLSTQTNAMFFGLALPAHFGLIRGLREG
jgi:hypothetical protein